VARANIGFRHRDSIPAREGSSFASRNTIRGNSASPFTRRNTISARAARSKSGHTETSGAGGVRVAESLEELLAGASLREPMNKTSDSLSGSTFERVIIDGDKFVVKHLHVDDDWVARATGDLRCRPLLTWRAGILQQLPSTIDHCIVGAACGLGRGGLGAALLLRDVSDELLPEGDGPMTVEQHDRFVAHMADLHAAFWGWQDTIGLQPLGNRLFELSPFTGDVEAILGGTDVVPPLIRPGWERLPREAPFSGHLVWNLLDDANPLLEPVSQGPQTFIHGDLKAGNLGCTSDGRTILLDWAVPGQAPGLLDLSWYLAVNCDRLPESKEAAIERYREALEHRGIETAGWWDEQLGLALIFGFVQMGWSKQGAELEWWDARVEEAAPFLR
jgi:Phosphotransferase enzyme family